MRRNCFETVLAAVEWVGSKGKPIWCFGGGGGGGGDGGAKRRVGGRLSSSAVWRGMGSEDGEGDDWVTGLKSLGLGDEGSSSMKSSAPSERRLAADAVSSGRVRGFSFGIEDTMSAELCEEASSSSCMTRSSVK